MGRHHCLLYDGILVSIYNEHWDLRRRWSTYRPLLLEKVSYLMLVQLLSWGTVSNLYVGMLRLVLVVLKLLRLRLLRLLLLLLQKSRAFGKRLLPIAIDSRPLLFCQVAGIHHQIFCCLSNGISLPVKWPVKSPSASRSSDLHSERWGKKRREEERNEGREFLWRVPY